MIDQQAGKRIVERMIEKYGCLPSAPDGPVIPAFNPVALADAIASEIERSAQYGWSKITIHMDVPDAAKLMTFLTRS